LNFRAAKLRQYTLIAKGNATERQIVRRQAVKKHLARAKKNNPPPCALPQQKHWASPSPKRLISAQRFPAVHPFPAFSGAARFKRFFLPLNSDSAFDYQDKRLILRRFLQNHCFIL
jgi:hypothetical protein